MEPSMKENASMYHPAPRRQRFCSQCGTPVVCGVPPGDNRERDFCTQCGAIHYQNPRLVVGTLPVWENRILLCLRAIEPRARTWTLPAGFLELAESTQQGALRETREEAGIEVTLGSLYTVIDIPRVDQVHLYFLATAGSEVVDPGPESLDARYYAPEEIPWDCLSFPSVTTTLQHYLRDREKGGFPTRHYTL